MTLVRSSLSIFFDSATKPWLEMREILRVAAAAPQLEIQTAPLVIERPDRKKRIIIHVRELTHMDEHHSSINDAKKEVINFMVSMDKASSFPTVARMRFETMFIEPVSMPFHELVDSLKHRFLLPTRIVANASDLALIFDQREEGGILKHVQIGPMDKAQLESEVLRWPAKSLPVTCVFLGLFYELVKAQSFSQGALEAFLETATGWQSDEAASLILELREILA